MEYSKGQKNWSRKKTISNKYRGSARSTLKARKTPENWR
jgi:hypothetical protein